jgi:RNA polymerase sigma-70 factor (ECF subfamily)
MKAGDIGGLATLVERYQVQAIRTAYLIVRERPLAEDITQAAFVRAYERIDQFDPGKPFGPWFMRSVANDAIKAVQRARRTVPLNGESDNAGPVASLHADPGRAPLAILEAAEDAAAVWDALDRLPPEQRAVMVLRYFDGLSDAEIADQVDAPPATVRWRLFAARSKLRTWLGARAD